MGFVNFEVNRRELQDPEFWEDTFLFKNMYMDGVLPPCYTRRAYLELDECNMDYSFVKTNANKTTAAAVLSPAVY